MTLRDAIRDASLLDCTIRDGGYYTAWDFPSETVSAYLGAVAELPIQTVELGYCNLPQATGYFGRYYYLTAETTAWARSLLGDSKRLAVMLDEKSLTPEHIPRLLNEHRGIVDLVRIATAPERLPQAAELAHAIADAGFGVGVNVMYLSRYSQHVEELSELNVLAPVVEAVSLVDSFGACLPDEVATAVTRARDLVGSTAIGFHGHDNLGLAFANSLAAAGAGASIIDTTLTGMGRGPGNTKTELLLAQLAALTPDLVNLDALNRGVEVFDELRSQFGWGTNLAYMISGASGLPQKDVMDWLGKSRYSLTAILRALDGSQASVDTTDHPAVTAEPGQRAEVIILGGGATVRQHIDIIAAYASAVGATLVHANYRHLDLVSRFEGRQFACVAGEAAARLPESHGLKALEALVVPSGPRYRGATPSQLLAPIKQAAPFLDGAPADQLGPVPDTAPLSLALGVALAIQASSVTLIGFDGYADASAAQQEIATETQAVIDSFLTAHSEIPLSSGTPTRYGMPTSSLYGRLLAARA